MMLNSIKANNSVKKMGRRPKETFLQKRYTDIQEAHEKMLFIADYQRNANQNYNEISLHTSQNGHHQKIYKQMLVRMQRKWNFLALLVELLGHMVVLFLGFQGISIPSSIVAVSIYIPTNRAKRFPFLHTLYGIYCSQIFFFFDGHSDWCEVISHCSFDLHFSNNEQC